MAKEAELKILLSAQDKASGVLGKATSSLGGLKKAGMGITAAGAGIVAGLGMAMKSAVDFEGGMREVNTMMGLGQDEFKALSDDVLNLSKDIGVDAVESTKALYQAISAGVPKENAVDFLAIATKAAIGGVTDTETAVDGLTTVINAFKMPLSDTQKVADIMFTTVKGGKTTFDELSASLFQVAPIAAASGVAFEEVSAALATMTKQGVPTSVATTQLRQAMVSLQKPTAEMSKVITDLGYDSGQTMLAELGLAGTLNTLRDATGGSNEQLMKMFGSVEAGQAVLALTGENAEMFTQDLEAMEKATEGAGAATEAFQEINEGAGRQFTQLKEQMKGVMVTIGNQLIPIMTPLVKKIAAVIQKVVQWMEQNPELTSTIVKVVAVLGGLMVVLGPILMMLPGIAAAAPMVGAAFTMMLGPVGLIIAAIAALIAIGIAVWKNWDKIKEMAKKIWENIKNFFIGIWEKIKNIFKEHWDKILAILFPAVGIPILIARNWDKIKDFFKGLWEKIKDIFKAAVNFLIGIVEGFVNFWIKGINFIINGLNKISIKVPDWVPFVGGKEFGVNIPNVPEITLPRLAEGGIIKRPTALIAGERGPEVIAPLRQAMGYNVTYVQVFIGDEKVADLVDKSLDRRKRIQQVV